MGLHKASAVIVGGGPAGCQCALWLHMLGHHPIIIEQSPVLGGLQALSPYQNHWIVGMQHQSGKQVAASIQAHIKALGIPVLLNTKLSSVTLTANGVHVAAGSHEIDAPYLVIATGVNPRRDVFKESNKVIVGPDESIFTMDFSGKRVALLGGGDNAYENQAFIMTKNPAVCDVYARTKRARKNLAELVNPAHVYTGAYHADQSTMKVTHDNNTREYDLFIVLYGWEANIPKALDPWRERLLDDRGFIATDAHCQTNLPECFAIGEVANRMHPCVTTAMADGVVAAKAIQAGLERAAD